MKKRSGNIYIGTSNVTVSGNKSTWPEAYWLKSRLHYYSSIFNSVEINSSFYKNPRVATYEKWAMDVPENFVFTLKLTRDITHAKELLYDPNHIENFFRCAEGIGEKKGFLLLQFPGKIKLGHFKIVEQLFNRLQENSFAQGWRKAVEFRDESWYISETTELFDEYGVSMVLHDFSRVKNSLLNKKANFIYLRFHGPSGNYRDSYSNEFLIKKSFDIMDYAEQGRDVYIYFNNTIGAGYDNALLLKTAIQNCRG